MEEKKEETEKGVRKKGTVQRSKEEWADICIRFSALRGMGNSVNEALITLSLKYGKISKKSFYLRYTPFINKIFEQRKDDFITYGIERTVALDRIIKEAFAKGDLYLAKQTILDSHKYMQDIGLFPKEGIVGKDSSITDGLKKIMDKILESEKEEETNVYPQNPMRTV